METNEERYSILIDVRPTRINGDLLGATIFSLFVFVVLFNKSLNYGLNFYPSFLICSVITGAPFLILANIYVFISASRNQRRKVK